MRFFGVLLGTIGLLTVLGGALAIATGFPGGKTSTTATVVEVPLGPTPTGEVADADEPPATEPTDDGSTSSDETPADQPTDTSPEAPTGDGGIPPSPTPEATADTSGSTQETPTPPLFTADINVQAPRMELPTQPLMSVEATYTEQHQFGKITVAYRPGAYTAEYAAEVAAMAEEARVEANSKIGTNWDHDFTVFLVDQLFAEDCVGCQGFTESDFRWIFMLDDGSLVRDEFEALLVHEMTHLIAGNEIHLPLEIIYVEGLATWVMTEDLVNAGYVSPLQSTAWVYRAGALPSLQELIDDDYAGRMRKRVYYDGAAAFAFYVIERYGFDRYVALYQQEPLETVLGKPMHEIEAEFHAYLEPHADAVINGVDGPTWWNAASQVIGAYIRFYEDPPALSADQYRLLTLARLAINRADVNSALHYLAESGV